MFVRPPPSPKVRQEAVRPEEAGRPGGVHRPGGDEAAAAPCLALDALHLRLQGLE